jgi:Cof subfamily protein (haloacid dehalogenase superfamily)
MKYKLLAIDMDGTFLNESRQITERNLIAVKEAAEAGIKVVICSGRNPSALKLLLKDMPKKQPIIACNGSVILDHNKDEIFYEALDNDVLYQIIDVLRKDYDDSVYYQFFDGNVFCSEKFQNIIERFYNLYLSLPREYRMEFRIIPDSKLYIKENNSLISKLEIYDDSVEVIQEIRNKIELLPGIEVVSSGFNGIEITKKGSNKGSGLEILAKHYGISLDECIAVGNDENDLGMLKKAGLGIAVSNAKDYVQVVADYVTERDNENDAVAEVIEKFFGISI